MNIQAIQRKDQAWYLMALPISRRRFCFNSILAMAVRRGKSWRVDIPSPRPDGGRPLQPWFVTDEAQP